MFHEIYFAKIYVNESPHNLIFMFPDNHFSEFLISRIIICYNSYTRGVSWNLPVLLIDLARDMYTFLWFGIYVIFFYGQ